MESREDLMDFLMSASSGMPAPAPHGLPQPSHVAKAKATAEPKPNSSNLVATPKKVADKKVEDNGKWLQFRRKDTASSLASTPACKKKPVDPLLQSPEDAGECERQNPRKSSCKKPRR